MTAQEMWERYRKANPLTDAVCEEAWAFGSEPDKLAELVVGGVKTATSSLYALYEIEGEPLPAEGSYSIILDSRGDAKCIIKTTRVYVVPFNQVSEAHAYKEGEGNRTLAYWRKVHEEFFADCLKDVELAFSVTMDVVCEEFEVVYAE